MFGIFLSDKAQPGKYKEPRESPTWDGEHAPDHEPAMLRCDFCSELQDDNALGVKKIWSFIDAHHCELGTALFVFPVSILGLLIAGTIYGVRLLFG
jgi:hypothetical protein